MVRRISSGLVPNNSLWNYVKHSWMPWFDKWFTKQELFGKMSPGIFCNPARIHLWIYILCIFTSYVLTTFEHLWQMLIRRIFYLMLAARSCLSHFLITWPTPALLTVHCLAKADSSVKSSRSWRNLENLAQSRADFQIFSKLPQPPKHTLGAKFSKVRQLRDVFTINTPTLHVHCSCPISFR